MSDDNNVLLTKNGTPESRHDTGHGFAPTHTAASHHPAVLAAGARPAATGSALRLLSAVKFSATDYPHNCGTPSTPACPPPDLLLEARDTLISTLAGPDATIERRRGVMAFVDSFLTVVLGTTNELVQGTGVQPPAPNIQIEIDSGVAHVTVGEGVQPRTLAAVLEAFKIHKVTVDGSPVRP